MSGTWCQSKRLGEVTRRVSSYSKTVFFTFQKNPFILKGSLFERCNNPELSLPMPWGVEGAESEQSCVCASGKSLQVGNATLEAWTITNSWCCLEKGYKVDPGLGCPSSPPSITSSGSPQVILKGCGTETLLWPCHADSMDPGDITCPFTGLSKGRVVRYGS
eukprot:768588-Hanusia_phi.AAC.4